MLFVLPLSYYLTLISRIMSVFRERIGRAR
ncbi:unnamed protein product [Soboliphyme baturini]|uniref:Amino acid ABC transporter permease n=1 Tax=Soboliphyme baturini TaxID=241478 RepID=A0A183J8Y4_9BILA|nr:unnamed protein product [Soboliphyme baturini]